MLIVVYTLPNCQPCNAIKRKLDNLGLAYEIRDAIEHSGEILHLGHRQAPVVVAGDQHWSGYRPDLLQALPARSAALGIPSRGER